ncbi:E2 [Martes foina papillomavirus 1]|uniref:Regulatory protein E2 n=1 Tax=Martes foina papillomavirus 1 TaxID=2831903 RepID=A0AAE7UUU3_9PAPI|nr:E2 [Martes foina papillomavirus 1]
MENLSKRLDAVQEGLLTLYELGSTDLEDQVQHWNLLRQENVLMHFAKRAGCTRVGYQIVPPLAVSQERAKQAIEMHLTLQSLHQSQYGREPWSLTETSWERWTVDPQRCLKKGAQSVEVRFDGSRDNSMLYTLWQSVYYQDSEDAWCKAVGEVDYKGLYYREKGYKKYYVEFAVEARRYSSSGMWEVVHNNETLSSSDPVTSTTPPTDHGGTSPGAARRRAADDPAAERLPAKRRVGPDAAAPSTTSPDPGEADSTSPASTPICRAGADPGEHGRGVRPREPSPTPPPQFPEERRQQSERPPHEGPPGRARAAGGARKRQRGRGRPPDPAAGVGPGVGPLGPGPDPQPEQQHAEFPRCVGPAESEGGPRTAAAAEPPGDRRRGSPAPANAGGFAAPPAAVAGAAGGPPENFGPAGQGLFPAAGRRGGGPGHILREAGHRAPCLAVLRGPCNVLKCFRFRTKRSHRSLFQSISTTWYWTGDEGSERVGEARLLLRFSDLDQRRCFFANVRLPGGVGVAEGLHDM